jgi:hypothetical protein
LDVTCSSRVTTILAQMPANEIRIAVRTIRCREILRSDACVHRVFSRETALEAADFGAPARRERERED